MGTGKLYDLATLRGVSVFKPDVRVQQVTVPVDADHFESVGKLRRQAEVIMVLRREPGLLLLVNKSIYPADVYRLPTGGVDPGEVPQATAAREIYEETGYRVDTPGLLGVVDYTLYGPGMGSGDFVSYVFVADVPSTPQPRSVMPDEVDGYRWIPAHRLGQVAEQLRDLPPNWRRWGCFRAVSYDFIQCGIMQRDHVMLASG